MRLAEAQEQLKRGLAAPLLFLAFALAAQGSAHASPLLWLAALAALISTWWTLGAARPPLPFSLLAAAIGLFAAWTVATNLWANPAYSASAPFAMAFLVGGFLLGRRAAARDVPMLFGTALAFAVTLALWGTWQRVGLNEGRSHAIFETPAMLAATLNFVLLPMLVFVALGGRNRWLLAPLLLVAAGSALAASRGGWLGLAAGLAFAGLLAHRAGGRVNVRGAVIVVTVIGSAMLFGELLGRSGHALLGEAATQSSLSRFGLYQLAIDGIARTSPLFGSGYLTFHYLLDSEGRNILAYEQATTYFVHNDYLQALLELGVPGLAALLVLLVTPLAMAWRMPRVEAGPRIAVVGAAGGMVCMAVHALVDFPFYIPLCLLLYGAAAGVLDGIRLAVGPDQGLVRAEPSAARRASVAAVTTLAAWMLIVPAAAEAAAEYGHYQWRRLEAKSAVYWLELARRIEPRDWRYHWYAGQFWLAQAQLQPRPEAARLADRCFAAGEHANPYEVSNLVGRIATHRLFAQYLASPADAGTLREWMARALRLAPRDQSVQAQAALVRKQFGP